MPLSCADRQQLRQGLEHFRGGDFFAAHDDWEEVWQGLRGRQRLFWQAMIQLAVGMVHWHRGNLKGCRSVWHKALHKCDQLTRMYDTPLPDPLIHLIALLADALGTVDQGLDPAPIMTDFAASVISEAWFDLE